jgi:dipeptidyl aminopeptidase/acylaminoacyl peptidase
MRLAALRKLLVASFCVCVVFPAAMAAQSGNSPAHIDEILRGLNRGHYIGQVAISPDGKQLAWIADSEIRISTLGNPDLSRQVTAATSSDQSCSEDDLAWSPDSRTLAFFSDCADPGDQADLYLAGLDGAQPRRITQLHGYAGSPAFSPDGGSIAFLYVKGATRPAGALAAMTPFAGVIGEDGVEVQRIAVARTAASAPAPPAIVSPPNLHVYEFDWSPDSKSLAYVAAVPPGENNWWVARLYTQTLDGAPKPILAPAEVAGPLHGLQIAVPRWSPDGKSIAFIGGLMSDQGATGGDVWVVASVGGAPRDLTADRPTSPAWIAWQNDRSLFVSELAGGSSQLVLLTLHGDAASRTTSATAGDPIFSFPGTAEDGRLEHSLSSTADRSLFVFHASSFDQPMEIYAAHTAGEHPGLIQLTHINSGVEPAWGKSLSLDWINDRFHVQGWLTLPRDYDPRKKYPLIVEVHGGPASAIVPYWGPSGSLSPQAFSALGYFVLQPNPRGSFGQGEDFAQANRKDFGYGDLRDILAGVDTVERQYPIDPGRVGLTGWSYGGFMTMFAVTQTHRFKAAVAGAGIANWLSYYGENSIDQWMIPYFGASVYDDPAVYAKSSAIGFIKQARTPTLVVVGDRDGECPAPQSFEFWHALRDLHVPTQLVVYPNEGHGFVDPSHRSDVLERAAEWFARYLPPGS